MGLFSRIFSGGKTSNPYIVSGRNPGKGWIEANKYNKARGGFAGGYGAWTFGNIIRAHEDAETIALQFDLFEEDCEYQHPDFGMNCYNKAWLEEYERAQAEAAMLSALLGEEVDPEDLMDMDAVQEQAENYSLQLAEMYIAGDCWIPIEILEWAYYDVSDHNNR